MGIMYPWGPFGVPWRLLPCTGFRGVGGPPRNPASVEAKKGKKVGEMGQLIRAELKNKGNGVLYFWLFSAAYHQKVDGPFQNLESVGKLQNI